MTDSSRSPTESNASDLALAVACLRHVLGQLHDAVAALDDDQYCQNPVGVFESSIGGHVRHCLDHVEALLTDSAATIDYDARRRDTPIERERTAALRAFERLDRELAALKDADGGRPAQVPITIAADGSRVVGRSTLAREVLFVVSHTVHHNALIAGMIRLLGRDVPDDFGFAPSTLAYLQANSCVR